MTFYQIFTINLQSHPNHRNPQQYGHIALFDFRRRIVGQNVFIQRIDHLPLFSVDITLTGRVQSLGV